MRTSLLTLSFLIASIVPVAASDVVTLTADTFKSVIGQYGEALVEFYAPWCGHCKTLAPIYESLATMLKSTSKTIIAKVDCDAHKDLCSKMDVKGYPTLKWFPRRSLSPEDYAGPRDLKSLAAFVASKETPFVTVEPFMLTDATFEFLVTAGKHVIVEFFAAWSPSSNAFGVSYNRIAAAFVNEENCVIASLDSKSDPDSRNKYVVTEYPSLIHFDGHGAHEKYTGVINEISVLEFVNKVCGTHRMITGELSDKAGLIPDMNDLISNVMNGVEVEESIVLAQAIKGDQAAYYVKSMEKIVASPTYLQTELTRINKIISDKTTSSKKLDDFTIRRNILASFKASKKATKDEL